MSDYTSRYCHRCQNNWPNQPGFVTCPIDNAATQISKDDDPWDGRGGEAMTWAYAEKERRAKHELFEAYYKARLIRITDHAIAKLMTASDATIADWLLQLETERSTS